MSSQSFQEWSTERLALLDDIENAYHAVRGSGPGAKAAGQQINQAYAVLLSGQFQGFCRDLHLECAARFLAPVADPDLRQMLFANLRLGRKLDRGNPNPGNIGSDFNRFEMTFWPLVEAHHSQNAARKLALEELNAWRNAIAHQDFNASMLRGGRGHLAFSQVQNWRKGCEGLARSFDAIMKQDVYLRTGIVPWC